MTTTSILELERAIEALVQTHLATYEAQVRAAVQAVATRGQPPSLRSKRKAATAQKRKMEPRRTAAELGALCDRLYEAVEATPGETMSVIAPRLGVSTRALERPVSRLKQAGRVRTVGERCHMRYFPMAALSAT